MEWMVETCDWDEWMGWMDVQNGWCGQLELDAMGGKGEYTGQMVWDR